MKAVLTGRRTGGLEEATSNDVKIYDSIFDVVDDHTALLISNLFGSIAKPKAVKIPK